MTESAGELLFEVCTHEEPFARSLLKELAHHIGRLYGETIRACKGYDGLQDFVANSFMTGMAIEPNFGREEESATDIGEVQAKDEAAKPKAVCFKCKNTGNMGFSTYMRCDACG